MDVMSELETVQRETTRQSLKLWFSSEKPPSSSVATDVANKQMGSSRIRYSQGTATLKA